jgi:nucleotide-binding universal stress UspA family protein
VVPPRANRRREEGDVGYLVVGVDGSEQARRALDWALEEAVVRDLELRVVLVYAPGDQTSPYVRSYAFTPETAATERFADEGQRSREERASAARQQAERLVAAEVEAVRAARAGGVAVSAGSGESSAGRGSDRVGTEPGPPDVEVTTHVVADDRPVRALIRFAERADGLIVGSRGRGGFAGLLLGSVSQQLAQHAPCPVTIVPSPRS